MMNQLIKNKQLNQKLKLRIILYCFGILLLAMFIYVYVDTGKYLTRQSHYQYGWLM